MSACLSLSVSSVHMGFIATCGRLSQSSWNWPSHPVRRQGRLYTDESVSKSLWAGTSLAS